MWFIKALGWLILGIVGLVIIAAIFDETESDQLEVRRTEPLLGSGNVLDIKNVSQGPISIVDTTVNNRAECKPPNEYDAFENEKFVTKPGPQTLQVGQNARRNSRCEIVRTKIKTDKGTFEYTFNSRR